MRRMRGTGTHLRQAFLEFCNEGFFVQSSFGFPCVGCAGLVPAFAEFLNDPVV